MEKENWSLSASEVQLAIELEIGRRQLQSVKHEVQMQLNLTSWASWWILTIAKNCQRSKNILQGGSKWRNKRQEEVSGNSSTDSVGCQLWVWTRLSLYTTWMGPLVRVTYRDLTQTLFRLDRVKSSCCDCPAKIPVDFNASCFTCFISGSISPEIAEFCPTLRLVYFIARA
jgi:hypothetical protein